VERDFQHLAAAGAGGEVIDAAVRRLYEADDGVRRVAGEVLRGVRVGERAGVGRVEYTNPLSEILRVVMVEAAAQVVKEGLAVVAGWKRVSCARRRLVRDAADDGDASDRRRAGVIVVVGHQGVHVRPRPEARRGTADEPLGDAPAVVGAGDEAVDLLPRVL